MLENVSANGVWIDSKDLETIQTLRGKCPRTVGELPKLIGLLSYNRAQRQDCSDRKAPTNEKRCYHDTSVQAKEGKQGASKTPIQ